jgi:hypothetical protein
MSVLTLYTTKDYIRDCVEMAREANTRGVRCLHKASRAVSCKSLSERQARRWFKHASECIGDARKAKAEFEARRRQATPL